MGIILNFEKEAPMELLTQTLTLYENVMLSSVRMVRMLAVASTLTGCFGGPGFLTQKETGSQSAGLSVRIDGERTSATVSASATTALNISAGDGSSIAGATVKIPPGALNIDANIFMEESDTLASGLVGQNLGITLNQAAGKSVVVSVSGQMPTLNNPLTLSLPLAGAGLRLLADDQTIVIVFRAYDNGKTVEGVIPFSKIKIEGNTVIFDISRFGAYQPVFIPSSESTIAETAKVVETENKVLTKTEIKTLPKAEIGLLSISVKGRAASFEAKVTGADIKSCAIEMVETSGARKSWSLNGKSSGSKTFDESDAAIDAKARMSCLLVDGRTLVTAFAELKIAASEPTQPTASDPTTTPDPPNTQPPPSNELNVNNDYDVTASDDGKIINAQPAPSTTLQINLPKAYDMNLGFNVEIRNQGTGFVRIVLKSGDYFESSSDPIYLYASSAKIKLTASGTWSKSGDVGAIGRRICGTSGFECRNYFAYPDSYIGTFSYKVLERKPLGITNVWVDALGSNYLLRADGLDYWQRKLSTTGEAPTSTMTYTEADAAGIAGIACPANVYVDSGNKFSIGNCLYYTDIKTISAPLTTEGLSSFGHDWYAGNINTCSQLGMRLPVIYEVAPYQISYAYFPSGDAPAGWGGNPTIPSDGSVITATASQTPSNLVEFDGTSAMDALNSSTNTRIRCVVHSGFQ